MDRFYRHNLKPLDNKLVKYTVINYGGITKGSKGSILVSNTFEAIEIAYQLERLNFIVKPEPHRNLFDGTEYHVYKEYNK